MLILRDMITISCHVLLHKFSHSWFELLFFFLIFSHHINKDIKTTYFIKGYLKIIINSNTVLVKYNYTDNNLVYCLHNNYVKQG